MGDEDRELIDQAKQDHQSFGLLYTKYQPRVFRFFWHRLHDVEAAADLVQETFLRAFQALNKYRHRGFSYLTYLLRISRNLLVDQLRKKPTTSLDEAAMVIDDKQMRLENLVDNHLLWEQVQRLPAVERETLEQFYRLGQSVNDIARHQRRSPNAVKLSLSRARQALRHLDQSP